MLLINIAPFKCQQHISITIWTQDTMPELATTLTIKHATAIHQEAWPESRISKWPKYNINKHKQCKTQPVQLLSYQKILH